MVDILERFKSSFDFKMNVLYTITQGLYWMLVCCTVSMGSAYLSNRGYSTFAIGLLFAIAYLFAAIVQQVVSVATDSSTSFDVVDVLAVLGGIVSIDLFIALFTSGKGFATGMTFLLAAMIATVIQPFLNALNFHIESYKVSMNYGVARASGSFFFFLMSLIVGFFMKVVSEKATVVLGFIVAVLFTYLIFVIYRELKASGIKVRKEFDPLEHDVSEGITLDYVKSFIERYRMFFMFLIGLVCFFFGHIIVNNFLFQIAVNVGGDEGANGGLLALQAIVELPAMIFFNWLRERFGNRLLLGTASVFYLIKIFFTAIATSVGMLYFSMIFQALSFALFIPASVHLVDEIMPKSDAVKGQAFITIAMTFSSLLGSVLGGLIINLCGVSATLWFGTFVTFIGTIITIWSLLRINTQK
ncbi:MFS transporter, PPP family, 3-phenylpropionic acid transporter [Pseudobutyrivibrio sp. YE44]|uniref:MFS transporter n=1 Tax=Pseudobutyrivibrio sp. YE44 TaxID=1520802 RepID=UPI0008922046|nr:MFS transporter [Pseudobutyrivibrio sp. YE44]SDB08360.1 MFS transporter, PPP family, 3-phenylpropionic acid transporter [Pseudobutyrivibrio sp. YE44]